MVNKDLYINQTKHFVDVV